METQFPGQGIASIHDDSPHVVIRPHAGDAEGVVTREFRIGTDEVPRGPVAKVQTGAIDWRADDADGFNPHLLEFFREQAERHDVCRRQNGQ